MEENIGLRYPLNAQIEVTEDCNHKCFYCYNHWRDDSPKNKKMSKQSAEKLMGILFAQIKPFDTVITGGEPLMNLQASLEIAKRLYERKAPCSMNTNLSLLNPDKLSQLKSANSDMGFLVSLPSVQEEDFNGITNRNNLKAVLNNLENLIEEGFDPTINMVVHKINKDSVYQQGKFLVENFGVKSFAMTPALRPAFRKDSGYHLNNDEMVGVLRDLVKLRKDFGIKVNALEVIPYCVLPEDLREDPTFRRSCGAGRATVQIAYNGEIRTCGHSPFVEGNVFEESFKDIWDRLNAFRKNKYVPTECQDCAEVDFCKGGCRYEGLREGEGLDKKDSMMVGKLEEKVQLKKLPQIDDEKNYQINLYGTRKEGEDRYILYNDGTLLVNEQMKNFVEGIKSRGFRLNDYPENLRLKAETFGRILKAGGFIIE